MMLRLVLALSLLSFASAPAKARLVEAVASFTVLADMVHQVGGDRVHVTSLVGVNGDPHAYEPSPDDAKRLKSADVVFVSGLGLEGWMERLIKASGFKGRPVVASTGLQPLRMQEDGRQVADPHAWNSAANGIVYVQNIVAALSAADPDGAAFYRASGDRYINELRQLDARARQWIGAIPAARRRVLTSHEAFGYFAAAYGVTFLSPVGLSTEGEASARALAGLIRQIKAEKVQVYFLENSNDPRLVKQVAAATGAKPGGVLFVESLSNPDGPAPTYAAMFQGNVDKLIAGMER